MQNQTRIHNNSITAAVRAARTITAPAQAEAISPLEAAETILRRYAARAISILSNPRTLDDGRTLPARLSANDCYVALEESCRKMARVAVRKYEAETHLHVMGFADALDIIFPDPPAYLTRCIRSVIADAERAGRREVATVSMDQPIGGGGEGDNALCLRDTFKDEHSETQPEAALLEQDDRQRFRGALARAMQSIPKNYLEALQRDVARGREREEGVKTAPESDKERQTVCRARAAVSEILKRECGLDNPFVRLIAQSRSGRVRQKQTPSKNTSAWTAEKQSSLFQRLLSTTWQERAQQGTLAGGKADGALDGNFDSNIEEAIVNDVSTARGVASPSPEMRQSMRVMDLYYFGDEPSAEKIEAQELYNQAEKARHRGKIEEAIRLYRQAYELEPRFFAALNEVGVLLMQTGNLRDALKVYLTIVEHPEAGAMQYIAATNAADVYLHWFDAGRNKDRNIERAAHYAQMAMRKPTPMRACNLILAYVKDRYYQEAQQVMDTVLHGSLSDCPADKFLQTLFQIRDADLVAWWSWLDSEMGKDEAK